MMIIMVMIMTMRVFLLMIVNYYRIRNMRAKTGIHVCVAFCVCQPLSVFVYCWNTKRFAVIKADENYWVVLAITHMFEVGCIVEVSDVDARSRG